MGLFLLTYLNSLLQLNFLRPISFLFISWYKVLYFSWLCMAESQGPRLPVPVVLDRGPVQPLKGAALSTMPRNESLNVAHAPMAAAKPQRTLNRKQRKAMEAKKRKAVKARKQIAV